MSGWRTVRAGQRVLIAYSGEKIAETRPLGRHGGRFAKPLKGFEKRGRRSHARTDASLIVAAEALGTRKVLTVDRRDFTAYRIRRGHRDYGVELLG